MRLTPPQPSYASAATTTASSTTSARRPTKRLKPLSNPPTDKPVSLTQLPVPSSKPANGSSHPHTSQLDSRPPSQPTTRAFHTPSQRVSLTERKAIAPKIPGSISASVPGKCTSRTTLYSSILPCSLEALIPTRGTSPPTSAD